MVNECANRFFRVPVKRTRSQRISFSMSLVSGDMWQWWFRPFTTVEKWVSPANWLEEILVSAQKTDELMTRRFSIFR